MNVSASFAFSCNVVLISEGKDSLKFNNASRAALTVFLSKSIEALAALPNPSKASFNKFRSASFVSSNISTCLSGVSLAANSFLSEITSAFALLTS